MGNNCFKNEKDKESKDLDVAVTNEIKSCGRFSYLRTKGKIYCVFDLDCDVLVLCVKIEGEILPIYVCG